MTRDFLSLNDRSATSYTFVPVTPSDSADLALGVTRGLMIAVGGTLTVLQYDGTSRALTVPAGTLMLGVLRVLSTGTAATGITALY